jgi:hypothetical protein
MTHATTAIEEKSVPNTYVITIPHGVPVDSNNSWLRQVELREITGHDEQLLAQTKSYPLPFRSSFLLQSVLQNSNSDTTLLNAKIDKRKFVQTLPQGDRVALILNIRKIVFGDRISCTAACSSCKELLTFDLSVSELLEPMKADPKKEYPLLVEGYSIKIRPITGVDLELLILSSLEDDNNNNKTQENNGNISDVSETAKEKKASNFDLNGMTEKLVRSSITFSDPPLPQILSNDFIKAVSSKLEEIDPQANMVLELKCIACQNVFQTNFNAEQFILSEIDSRAKQLYREVHWIAFHYHWEENSILSLPLRRRKFYLELINKTLSGESI